MRHGIRRSLVLLTLGIFAAGVSLAVAEDGPGNNPPPPGQNGGGPGGGPNGGPGGGQGQQRGPQAGYHLIPRFAMDRMNLSDDQKKQIADLEADVKQKLSKILSADQMKTLEEARPPRPGGRGGPGGPGGNGVQDNGGPGAGPGGQGGGPGNAPGGGPGSPPPGNQ